jgi:hypothetical protein
MSIRARLLPPLDRPRLPYRLTRDGWWLVESRGGALDTTADALHAASASLAAPPPSTDAACHPSPESSS